jgi:hypothetical protein
MMFCPVCNQSTSDSSIQFKCHSTDDHLFIDYEGLGYTIWLFKEESGKVPYTAHQYKFETVISEASQNTYVYDEKNLIYQDDNTPHPKDGYILLKRLINMKALL